MKFPVRRVITLLVALLAFFSCVGGVLAEEGQSAEETMPIVEETQQEPVKMVALTFDDGPDKNVTGPVLDVLEKYGVKATFYLVGNKIGEDTAYLVERAYDLGCEIGCHGWCHSIMTKLSPAMNMKHIRLMREAMTKYVDRPISISTLRPPGGFTSREVFGALRLEGIPAVCWSIDTFDWEKHEAEFIFERVKMSVKDGDIILMHDRHQPTVDALELIIPYLQEEGYQLVTVSEILTRNGDPMEPGVRYTCMPAASAEEQPDQP